MRWEESARGPLGFGPSWGRLPAPVPTGSFSDGCSWKPSWGKNSLREQGEKRQLLWSLCACVGLGQRWRRSKVIRSSEVAGPKLPIESAVLRFWLLWRLFVCLPVFFPPARRDVTVTATAPRPCPLLLETQRDAGREGEGERAEDTPSISNHVARATSAVLLSAGSGSEVGQWPLGAKSWNLEGRKH